MIEVFVFDFYIFLLEELMKKFLIMFIVINLQLFGQDAIRGMKWGMTKYQVKSIYNSYFIG